MNQAKYKYYKNKKRACSFFVLASVIKKRLCSLGCGGWDRTNDLQVMSLTSYHCSTPRYDIIF